MKFNGDSGDFQNPSPGSHAAVCVKVIDLGTQPNSYQGKPSAPKRKIRIQWELAEKMADGRPFVTMKKYTASLNKKATLRKDIESWTAIKLTDGMIEKFNAKVLLGKVCLLSLIESNDGNYININSIMKLPKEIPAPAPVGDLIYFDLDEFDPTIFSKFSEKTKTLIMQSPEYQALDVAADHQNYQAGEASEGTDDIPF